MENKKIVLKRILTALVATMLVFSQSVFAEGEMLVPVGKTVGISVFKNEGFTESGIGTMTFYEPESLMFGALGHGICDEKNNLIQINGGEVLKAEIVSIKRGEKGSPGELIGVFTESESMLGEIEKNSDKGVYGKLLRKDELERPPLPTAKRDEVHEGEATILSDAGEDEVSEYEVEIIKINKNESDNRGMIVKVTDSNLIEKTGGIVRGMSGSPIIQNGKLVGAITHVFVGDPNCGYAIFIENMLSAI